MKISFDEQADIRNAVAIGEKWGFGNIVSHLLSACALREIEYHGLSEKEALQIAAPKPAYPLQMHIDITERGEYDETGKRYRPKKKVVKKSKK